MELTRSNEVVSPVAKVERELETRKIYGSFTLFLFGMAVPFFLMINVRFIMAAGFVPASVDQATGAIQAALLAVSGLAAVAAGSAVKKGQIAGYRRNVMFALVLGTISTLMGVYQWWYHPFDAMSHYGETFLSTVGLVVVMNLTGLLTLWASHARIRRVGITEINKVGYRTPIIYWLFLVVCALFMYVELYFV